METLEGRGERLVDLDTGSVSVEAVRRLGCDAVASRVVYEGGSGPLIVGRRTRLVPARPAPRLTARDGGCTHSSCDIPARWWDAHHLTHWADGGNTSLLNLSLPCHRDHRTVHHQTRRPERE